jgi:hypothetical protein
MGARLWGEAVRARAVAIYDRGDFHRGRADRPRELDHAVKVAARHAATADHGDLHGNVSQSSVWCMGTVTRCTRRPPSA